MPRLLKALQRRLRRRGYPLGYSPRGDADDKPNVRDSRYTFPFGDDPVTLPMQPRGTTYLIAATAVAALVAVMTALIYSR